MITAKVSFSLLILSVGMCSGQNVYNWFAAKPSKISTTTSSPISDNSISQSVSRPSNLYYYATEDSVTNKGIADTSPDLTAFARITKTNSRKRIVTKTKIVKPSADDNSNLVFGQRISSSFSKTRMATTIRSIATRQANHIKISDVSQIAEKDLGTTPATIVAPEFDDDFVLQEPEQFTPGSDNGKTDNLPNSQKPSSAVDEQDNSITNSVEKAPAKVQQSFSLPSRNFQSQDTDTKQSFSQQKQNAPTQPSFPKPTIAQTQQTSAVRTKTPTVQPQSFASTPQSVYRAPRVRIEYETPASNSETGQGGSQRLYPKIVSQYSYKSENKQTIYGLPKTQTTKPTVNYNTQKPQTAQPRGTESPTFKPSGITVLYENPSQSSSSESKFAYPKTIYQYFQSEPKQTTQSTQQASYTNPRVVTTPAPTTIKPIQEKTTISSTPIQTTSKYAPASYGNSQSVSSQIPVTTTTTATPTQPQISTSQPKYNQRNTAQPNYNQRNTAQPKYSQQTTAQPQNIQKNTAQPQNIQQNIAYQTIPKETTPSSVKSDVDDEENAYAGRQQKSQDYGAAQNTDDQTIPTETTQKSVKSDANEDENAYAGRPQQQQTQDYGPPLKQILSKQTDKESVPQEITTVTLYQLPSGKTAQKQTKYDSVAAVLAATSTKTPQAQTTGTQSPTKSSRDESDYGTIRQRINQIIPYDGPVNEKPPSVESSQKQSYFQNTYSQSNGQTQSQQIFTPLSSQPTSAAIQSTQVYQEIKPQQQNNAYQQPSQTAQASYQQTSQTPQASYQQSSQTPQASYQQSSQTPQTSYQQPSQPPQASYQQPSQQLQVTYFQPAQPNPTYQQPRVQPQISYQRPSQPNPTYQQPNPTYQRPSQPNPTYQQPSQTNPTYQQPSQPTPTYQRPSQPNPTYQQPSQPSPTYQRPSQPNPTYQQPSQPNPIYQQPSQLSPTYQQPSQPNPTYQQPSQPSPTYQRPSQPNPTYQQPPQPNPTYQQPSQPNPTYQQPPQQPQIAYLQSPKPKPTYQLPSPPQQINPQPAPQLPQITYSQPSQTTYQLSQPTTQAAYQQPSPQPFKPSSQFQPIAYQPSSLPQPQPFNQNFVQQPQVYQTQSPPSQSNVQPPTIQSRNKNNPAISADSFDIVPAKLVFEEWSTFDQTVAKPDPPKYSYNGVSR